MTGKTLSKDWYRVGIISVSADLLKQCALSLADLQEVTVELVPTYPSTEASEGTADLDLLLFHVQAPLRQSLIGFAALREMHPGIPVIVLGDLADDWVAVLRGCGAIEHLRVPVDRRLLRYKVVHGLRSPSAAVAPRDLRPLFALASTIGTRGARRAYRAPVPSSLTTPVMLTLNDYALDTCLGDLSLDIDDAWGGMLLVRHARPRPSLATDKALIQRWTERLQPGQGVRLRADLRDGRRDIAVRAVVVRLEAPSAVAQALRVGLIYQPEHRAARTSFESFYMRCQRAISRIGGRAAAASL